MEPSSPPFPECQGWRAPRGVVTGGSCYAPLCSRHGFSRASAETPESTAQGATGPGAFSAPCAGSYPSAKP